jgi:hypothetical protein
VSLEQDLRRLGADLAFPATPDIAAAVTAGLPAAPARRRPLWRPRRLVLVLAAALLAAAVALAVSPSARSAIEDFLGLRGATVHRVRQLPQTGRGAPLALGRRVTLADAQRLSGFHLLQPPSLGAPAEVWRSQAVPGGIVTLLYAPGPSLPASKVSGVGALLSEFRGDLAPGLIDKAVGMGGATAAHARVGGEPGIWVEGPHDLMWNTSNGIVAQPTRLAGSTLLWQHGRLLLRLESGLSRARAIALAESLR